MDQKSPTSDISEELVALKHTIDQLRLALSGKTYDDALIQAEARIEELETRCEKAEGNCRFYLREWESACEHHSYAQEGFEQATSKVTKLEKKLGQLIQVEKERGQLKEQNATLVSALDKFVQLAKLAGTFGFGSEYVIDPSPCAMFGKAAIEAREALKKIEGKGE